MIIESKDRTKNPVIKILTKGGDEIKAINLPVQAHVIMLRIRARLRLEILSSRSHVL